MKEYIKNNVENGGFTYGFIKEANISLNYLKDKGENITDIIDNYRNVINLCEVIDRFDKSQFIEDANAAINTLKNYLDNGAITPLSLKDDEFEKFDTWYKGKLYRNNIRCPYIKKINDDVYNFDAYKLNIIKNYYINKGGNFITYNNQIYKNNPRLYLSKGGIIDGHFIEECIIKENEVIAGDYVHKGAVKIDASCIHYDKNFRLFFADVRNKKVNVLKRFYNVKVYYEDTFKKIDIRNFKDKSYEDYMV